MNSAIELRDVGWKAGTSFELQDISLSVPMGSIYGFLGRVVDWIDRTIGVDEPGPAVFRSSSTGTTLLIALLAGVAFVRARRRQVA